MVAESADKTNCKVYYSFPCVDWIKQGGECITLCWVLLNLVETVLAFVLQRVATVFMSWLMHIIHVVVHASFTICNQFVCQVPLYTPLQECTNVFSTGGGESFAAEQRIPFLGTRNTLS